MPARKTKANESSATVSLPAVSLPSTSSSKFINSPIQLTQQQQSIVAHDRGPAIVFAVAGAGKTTAIEHRIARLVRDGIFAPNRILVTAFNTKNAQELTERLHRWPNCQAVTAKTLNGLGNAILRHGYQTNQLPYLTPQSFDQLELASDKILSTARTMAFRNKVWFADELNALDRDDFMTYISHCKGNLRYADLEQKKFSKPLRKLATQAEAPGAFPWYLDFYQLYERIRCHELGIYTFDDQLMTGWELLARNSSILHHFQSQYDCIIVDEFQDVNKAQAEMLDLLVKPHGNYMVVGDDDQTIYEWRGADPSYILNFEKRYKAKAYFMTENFRCMASHVVLANQVIRHNSERRSKKIELTKGFGGATHFTRTESTEKMGEVIVDQVQQLQNQATALKEMAVLIRVYAQTPPIEQQLIVRGIPYEIVGSVPFYMRREVNTLIAYCRIAYLEKARQVEEAVLVMAVKEWKECWSLIYWQPNRYIKREVAQQISETCMKGASLADALQLYAGQARESTAEKMRDLAHHLSWLMQAIPPDASDTRPADQILQELDNRIGYSEHLRDASGFTETGADRAETVAAFIRYARGQGSLLNFLGHVKQLRQEHEQTIRRADDDFLPITTIFRAKGMEWPHVFVPNCNDEVIPYKRSNAPGKGGTKAREEERRLLYVAITRAKQNLYLYALKDEPLSPFLTEAAHTHTLKAVGYIAAAGQKPPTDWDDTDIWSMAVHACRLHLHHYIINHWGSAASEGISKREAAARLVASCHQAIKNRGLQQELMVTDEHIRLWRSHLPPNASTPPLDMPPITARMDQLEKTMAKRRAAEAKRRAEEDAAERLAREQFEKEMREMEFYDFDPLGLDFSKLELSDEEILELLELESEFDHFYTKRRRRP